MLSVGAFNALLKNAGRAAAACDFYSGHHGSAQAAGHHSLALPAVLTSGASRRRRSPDASPMWRSSGGGRAWTGGPACCWRAWRTAACATRFRCWISAWAARREVTAAVVNETAGLGREGSRFLSWPSTFVCGTPPLRLSRSRRSMRIPRIWPACARSFPPTSGA